MIETKVPIFTFMKTKVPAEYGGGAVAAPQWDAQPADSWGAGGAQDWGNTFFLKNEDGMRLVLSCSRVSVHLQVHPRTLVAGTLVEGKSGTRLPEPPPTRALLALHKHEF